MKKAILAASFGTTYPDAEENCIGPVEDALRSAFPEYELRRAFTSALIVNRLRSRGIDICNVSEAIRSLQADGFESIAVVPTHILGGTEYEQLTKKAALGYPVSEPLLATETDLNRMAYLLGRISVEEGRPLLMMGHGTDHAAGEIYTRLREKLPENVLLACLEGELRLEKQLPALELLSERKLTLMPLMLTAGNHARNNMAGDGRDSWKSLLLKRGFDVRIRMQGLGAVGEVRQMFVEKAAKILC